MFNFSITGEDYDSNDNEILPSSARTLLSKSVAIMKRDKGRPQFLRTDKLIEINDLYRKQIPEFNQLVGKYEAEKERARKTRTLATFPSLEAWQPEGHPLNLQEQEMAQPLTPQAIKPFPCSAPRK